jgi:preprotein translocase subunit SecF
MFIVQNRHIWYTVSAVLIAASIAAVSIWGLKFGIDFTGGSILEIAYSAENVPAQADVIALVEGAGIAGASVRATGDTGFLIRTPFLIETEYTTLSTSLGGTEIRYDSIGPSIGTELQTRAVYAVLLVLLMITLFIAFVFRHVSKPVSSWKYGVVALLALAHDVIVPLGAFALMGHYWGAEVDTLFVTAILVILGFSVHDTIVVFDRTRENLKKLKEDEEEEAFDVTVGRSVTQTLSRSINTSLTTVLALIALYVFGPEVTHYFVLALIIGIVTGTYSSIFIGSPLLVTLQKMQKVPVVEESKHSKKKK